MSVQVYDVGDLVHCTAVFADAVDVPTDPTTVTFRLRPPMGAALSYVWPGAFQVVRDAVGAFHVDVAPTMPGTWYWRWEATGDVQAVQEGQFLVMQSAF